MSFGIWSDEKYLRNSPEIGIIHKSEKSFLHNKNWLSMITTQAQIIGDYWSTLEFSGINVIPGKTGKTEDMM